MKAVHGSKKPRKTIAVLEAENAELRARVASLEALVQTLATKPVQFVPVPIAPDTFRVQPEPHVVPHMVPHIGPTTPLQPLTPTYPWGTITVCGRAGSTVGAATSIGTFEVLS